MTSFFPCSPGSENKFLGSCGISPFRQLKDLYKKLLLFSERVPPILQWQSKVIALTDAIVSHCFQTVILFIRLNISVVKSVQEFHSSLIYCISFYTFCSDPHRMREHRPAPQKHGKLTSPNEIS